MLCNMIQYDTSRYVSLSRFHGIRKKWQAKHLSLLASWKPVSKKLSARFAFSTFRRRKIDKGADRFIGRGRSRNAKVQSRNKLIQFSFFREHCKTLIVMQNKTLGFDITLPFVLIAKEGKLFHPPLIRCLFF